MPLLTRVIPLLLTLAATALGVQAQVSIGSADDEHAWLALPSTLDRGVRLYHVPPRNTTSIPGAPPGSITTARRLSEAPQAMVAHESGIYLIYPPNAPGAARRVLSLSARPAPVNNLWVFHPDGRLEPHPSLPGDQTLYDVAATDRGLFALVGNDRALLRLAEGEWTEVEGPELTRSGRIRLLGESGMLAILETGPAPRLWVQRAEGEGWDRVDVAPEVSDADWVLLVKGQLVIGTERAPGLEIQMVTGSTVASVAKIEIASPEYSVVPLRLGGGRVLIAWASPEESDQSPGRQVVECVEVSLSTGQVLHRGTSRSAAPISSREFALVAMLLIGLMASVLLVVIRTDGGGELVIPAATALADPSRRFLATLIDGFLATFVAAAIAGVPVSQVLTLEVLLTNDDSWMVIPMVVGVAWLHGTLGEGLIGRSVGKLLLSTHVVRTGELDRPPGLGWSALRNAIKWLLPPVVMLAALDGSGRHRADVLARSVVVVRLVEPADG